MNAKLINDVKIKEKISEQRFNQYIKLKNLDKKVIKKVKYTQIGESYDASVVSGTTVMLAEIKVRADKDIAYFQQNGPFIELKKIEGMQRKVVEINDLFGHLYPNVEKFYYNFCKDGIIIYRLLDPWDYDFKWEWLPKNNTNLNEKEWKMVHSLLNPIEIIKYNK